MTESKHTPGPWELTTLESNHGDSQHFISPGSCKPTLMAGTCSTEDAHLIAAAPELLAVVENMMIAADDNASASEIVDYIDWSRARAALAKARGVEANELETDR